MLTKADLKTEWPQILGNSLRNLLASATRPPEIFIPLVYSARSTRQIAGFRIISEQIGLSEQCK